MTSYFGATRLHAVWFYRGNRWLWNHGFPLASWPSQVARLLTAIKFIQDYRS